MTEIQKRITYARAKVEVKSFIDSKIVTLKWYGFPNDEIGKIVGKNESYVLSVVKNDSGLQNREK